MFDFFKKGKQNTLSGNDFDVVRNIIIDILPELSADQITPDTTFEMIGFDSIKFINLLLSLEDYIEKDLEDIVAALDLTAMKTVGDLTRFVSSMR